MEQEKISLTQYTQFSGCGAKLGPAMLDKALCGLSQPKYENLIADFSYSEDAGIYKVSEDIAVIQTVDFFPPIVDDPFTFGQIAAANSLSDLYAMGAKPITALSVVGFPQKKIHHSHLRAMMEGGMDKLIESETALVGGHSIDDNEVKFGFAVTGTVHPKKAYRNNTIKEGDLLILTKPIGTGVINTALRADMVSKEAIDQAIKSMTTLNKIAAESISEFNVSACTDVTGFGLLGHACEMINGSDCGIEFEFDSIPLLPNVKEYISMGLIPAGTYNNKDFRLSYIENSDDVSKDIIDILFDPQTSGGLLISMPEKDALKALEKMKNNGIDCSIIGTVNENNEKIRIIE